MLQFNLFNSILESNKKILNYFFSRKQDDHQKPGKLYPVGYLTETEDFNEK